MEGPRSLWSDVKGQVNKSVGVGAVQGAIGATLINAVAVKTGAAAALSFCMGHPSVEAKAVGAIIIAGVCLANGVVGEIASRQAKAKLGGKLGEEWEDAKYEVSQATGIASYMGALIATAVAIGNPAVAAMATIPAALMAADIPHRLSRSKKVLRQAPAPAP
jgi:hypothetical protein